MEIIESVQIIRIEETEFIFDYDAVKSIIELNKECSNMPVAIIIINGALRTGKSFFNNFVIRHLLAENYNANNMLVDYFRSRRGADIQTLGIWALNKIFIHRGKAIILMDTQGIFDRHLNQAMTTALICLSTLMSSYQIYNLDKRIQEDHLNNMAYFSAYTDLMDGLNMSNSKEGGAKIGQTLSLLVRDWQNFEDNLDLKNCIAETERYQEDFLSVVSEGDCVKQNTRNKIMDTFDNVNVKLCPHPGHLVTEGVFSGNLRDVRKEFILHIDYIIDDILNNIEAKRISSKMSLICSDVPEFMQRYVELYRDIKDSLPEPQNILETTSKISQTGAKTNTVSKYKQVMTDAIKSASNPTKKNIAVFHIRAKKDACRYFDNMCVMGEESDIKSVMNSIICEIELEYTNFELMAIDENFTYIINKIVDKILNYIVQCSLSLMSINFAELDLKFIIPIMFVSRYIMALFLPYGLYIFVDYIISNIMWIAVGMFIIKIGKFDGLATNYTNSNSNTNICALGKNNKKILTGANIRKRKPMVP